MLEIKSQHLTWGGPRAIVRKIKYESKIQGGELGGHGLLYSESDDDSEMWRRKKMHKNSKFNFKELDSFSVLKVDPKYKVLKTFS